MKTSRAHPLKIPAGILVFLIALAARADSDFQKLAAANNGFAFDLLAQLAGKQPDQNIFISPFSVSTALQMLGNGARGQTRSEIQSVLKTDNLPQDQLNAACKRLNESLKSQTDAILDLANGIWYQNQFHLKADFTAVNKAFFGAELAPVDFESPNSADTINQWAGRETRGRINGVVSFPFPPLTRVVLANAIYFKGKWDKPFEVAATRQDDFRLANGDVKQAWMMFRESQFNYQETEDFQAVQLRYKSGLHMELFLPTANSSPQKLVEKFRDSAAWTAMESKFEWREGSLHLPRFRMDFSVELNGPLQSLGIKAAFDQHTANFSAMAQEPLFVSEVKQKSYVAVDEAGTEAAAVTEVTALASAMPINYFRMTLDHPFLFMITDDKTQTILFMGIVNNPAP